jgi:hypothetical protein
MPILLIILALTLGLAWRAGVPQRCWKLSGSDRSDEAGARDTGLIDACTRASVLVLMSLLGLLALAVTYGNVLNASSASP